MQQQVSVTQCRQWWLRAVTAGGHSSTLAHSRGYRGWQGLHLVLWQPQAQALAQAGATTHPLNGQHHIHALHHPPKHRVLAIQPCRQQQRQAAVAGHGSVSECACVSDCVSECRADRIQGESCASVKGVQPWVQHPTKRG